MARGEVTRRERVCAIYARLRDAYPDVHCTLDYHSSFELLIMTILAAQCTDARVNAVARDLFRRFPTPESFADADLPEIEAAVRSTGFFRNKAKSIQASCADLVTRHGVEVLGTMEELLALRGVGRTTANVILGECFGAQAVIVDTHCTRLAQRLGFTRSTDARKIERDLMRLWPQETWTLYSHLLVFHGRAICLARAPRCSQCCVEDLCPFPSSREGKRIAK